MGGIPNGLFAVIARQNASDGPSPPPDAGNLILQLNAKLDVFNTGTTQATDGQTVDQWVDASGAGNHLLQSVSGNRMTFQTNELNGNPGLLCDDARPDFMELATTLLNLTGSNFYSIYVLAQPNDVTIPMALLYDGDESTSNRYVSAEIRGDVANDPLSTAMRTGGGSVFLADTSTGVTVNTPFVGSWILDDGTSTSYNTSNKIDDGSEGTGTNDTFPGGTPDKFAIGMLRDSSPGSAFSGLLYYILIYDLVHDSATRTSVFNHMESEFGIT